MQVQGHPGQLRETVSAKQSLTSMRRRGRSKGRQERRKEAGKKSRRGGEKGEAKR